MPDEPVGITTRHVERLVAVVARLRSRLGLDADEAVSRVERFAADAPAFHAPMIELVRIMLRQRARRNERLGVDLFRDPAWDMLLELLVAHHDRRIVSVSGLCFSSGVPATTALRYVDRLEEEGLIRRIGDYADHRRVLVTIAPDRVAAVEALLAEMSNIVFVAADALDAPRAQAG